MKPEKLTADQIEPGDYLWWNGSIDKIVPVLVVGVVKTSNRVKLSILELNGTIKDATFNANLTLTKLTMNNV
jgi:hypothetical protein